MSRTVIEAHSISSAKGWRFASTGEAVAAFVLVSFIDSAYPNLGPNKCVLALDALDYADDLIGFDIGEIGSRSIERD